MADQQPQPTQARYQAYLDALRSILTIAGGAPHDEKVLHDACRAMIHFNASLTQTVFSDQEEELINNM
jgi:hypothetical protein